MKKIYVTLLMLCMTCMLAVAGNIKVLQGEKKFLKNHSGELLLEINWKDAQYDYRKPLSQEFPQFGKYAESSWSGFVQEFNKECDHMVVVKQSKNAKYKICIDISNVDQYLKITGLIPGPATKIWSTLTIVDIATGEVMVTVSFNEINGGASPSPYESFSDSFEELGEKVADKLQ